MANGNGSGNSSGSGGNGGINGCGVFDPVEQPSHYATLAPQPIDVAAAWTLSPFRAAALKYLARAGRKDPAKTAEDLRKAIKYLEREIELVETPALVWQRIELAAREMRTATEK